jgi:hypothetical protein
MVRMLSVTLIFAAAIGSVSTRGQTAAPDTKHFTSTGIVKAFSDSALTIAMKNGDMTFAIARSTRFIGKGLANDLVLREPRFQISRALKAGDRVSVTYRQSAALPTAVEVRVVERAGK